MTLVPAAIAIAEEIPKAVACVVAVDKVEPPKEAFAHVLSVAIELPAVPAVLAVIVHVRTSPTS